MGRGRRIGGKGGLGVEVGGYLKLFTSDCATHIAVGMGVGVWGWGNDGGGEGGGEGGWGEALIKVLNKTGIVTLSLVIGMHIMRRNSAENRNFWGVSLILAGNPHVMTP